jgi:hypothetical protein
MNNTFCKQTPVWFEYIFSVDRQREITQIMKYLQWISLRFFFLHFVIFFIYFVLYTIVFFFISIYYRGQITELKESHSQLKQQMKKTFCKQKPLQLEMSSTCLCSMYQTWLIKTFNYTNSGWMLSFCTKNYPWWPHVHWTGEYLHQFNLLPVSHSIYHLYNLFGDVHYLNNKFYLQIWPLFFNWSIYICISWSGDFLVIFYCSALVNVNIFILY